MTTYYALYPPGYTKPMAIVAESNLDRIKTEHEKYFKIKLQIQELTPRQTRRMKRDLNKRFEAEIHELIQNCLENNKIKEEK